MKMGQVAWIGVAAVVVGSLLPWAELDLGKVAEQQKGFDALAAKMLQSFGKDVELTAWNAHVNVGTAKIPAWSVLVAAVLAASLATLRARGVQAVPRAAAPIVAVIGLALVVTFGAGAYDSGRLLEGWWLAVSGLLVVAVGALPDLAAPSA